MKPRSCPYCERMCSFQEFDSHVDFCGSKTKKCTECGSNVLAKEMDLHIVNGQCQRNKEVYLTQTRSALEKFQEEEKKELERKKKEHEFKLQEERQRQRYE